MTLSIRADHDLIIQIAKACGIPTDTLRALTLISDVDAVTRIITEHYVITPGLAPIITTQHWTPEAAESGPA